VSGGDAEIGEPPRRVLLAGRGQRVGWPQGALRRASEASRTRRSYDGCVVRDRVSVMAH
jgi:hypothetical protein